MRQQQQQQQRQIISSRSLLLIAAVLTALCGLSEAQYKFRRPPPPPSAQIFKKSWAPGPRIPPIGNSLHMGPAAAGSAPPGVSFPHKRPLFKPPNYRFRRPPGPPPPPPPPLFNVLPNSYKSSPPLPPSSSLGVLANYATLPQQQQQQQQHHHHHHNHHHRAPVSAASPPAAIKELQAIAKVPQQYSPEYHPETAALSLSTHRGGIDDDKGPIHTIPAPNLGPASKSYQQQQQQHHHQQQQVAAFSNQQESGASKQSDIPRRPYTITQVDYHTAFNGEDSSLAPQRAISASPTPPNSVVHQYEVTESNEVNSGPLNYFTTDLDSAQYASSIVQEQQAAAIAAAATQQQQQQQQPQPEGPSMQANLHSSMHVGSGASSSSLLQQQSDLHVGQPAAAGPPMSAAKLYEVLNAFPQQLTDQYNALNQQPQIQQHLLQQQLSQILQQQQQQQDEGQAKTNFAQPTLHSFNYDEQANKQKQQSIYIDQNYAAGRVTADYSLAPDSSAIAQDQVNVADNGEQQENHIDYENPVGHVRPTSYFTKIGDDQTIATQYYTTLPNRETAEKLAALAAAGNVNSQLIGQLRKQQQQQQQQENQPQADQAMPANHKEEQVESGEKSYVERQRQQQLEHRQKLFYRRQKIREEQLRRDEEKENYRQQSKEDEEKHPLRIFVPEDNSEKGKEVTAEDYEYENDEADAPRENEPSIEDSEFGSRIVSKNRK